MFPFSNKKSLLLSGTRLYCRLSKGSWSTLDSIVLLPSVDEHDDALLVPKVGLALLS